MKITMLIIVIAIIGTTVGTASIWLDIPRNEPEKLLTSFIILGCALLVIVGLMSIAITNTINFCKKQLEELKKIK